MKTKLKKNDRVQVISGKGKGKKGRILRIDPSTNRVIIEGLNMMKKTQRPKRQNDKGGIIEIEASLPLPNVQLLCKKCGITRAGFKFEEGQKTRVCRKCGEGV